MLGLSPSETMKRNVDDKRWKVIDPSGHPIHPSDVPASIALRTRASVRGSVLGVHRPDGDILWLVADAVPLLDQNGLVGEIIVSFSDITRELTARVQLQSIRESLDRTIQERDASLKQLMEALEQSEIQSRTVLRSMAEGVVVHSIDGSILFANAAAERILGLSLAQMRGQHPVDARWMLTDDAGNPLEAARIPSEITRMTGDAQQNRVLGVRRGVNFEHAWLSVSTEPLRAPSHSDLRGPYAVVATFTDITKEREALADARRVRDQLRDLTSSLPGVVYEIWISGNGVPVFRYISDQCESLMGISVNALLAGIGSLEMAMLPEDIPILRQALLGAATDSGAFQCEIRILKEGNLRHFRFRSGPRANNGTGYLFRGVAYDITDQKLLEGAVRESQRRESLGTLAAGVAHNFNNMLAAIVPSIEIAQRIGSSEVREALKDAETAALAATELVKQLMQLVRRGDSQTMKVVDAREVAGAVVELCTRTFRAGLAIRLDAEDAPMAVWARTSELQQVLVNLCINARDALENRNDGRVVLRLKVIGEDVRIEVEDNGPGIPETVRSRLGEPFFTTKPQGKGTGLGLATAFQTIANFRGRLSFDSIEGKGTRFVIELPRYRGPQIPREWAPDANAAQYAGFKVLLIDDEDVVRNVITRTLERVGVCVHAAEDGYLGLGLLKDKGPFDLVLVDLNMPNFTGIEVVRHIRLENVSVPVYLMSGFVPDGADFRGVQGVLPKPMQIADLYGLVGRLIRERKG